VSDVNVYFTSSQEGKPTECRVAFHPEDAVVAVQVPAGVQPAPVMTPVTRTVSEMEYRCTSHLTPVTRTVSEYQNHCQMVSKPVMRMETTYTSQYDFFSKSTRMVPQTHSVMHTEMVNECRMVPVSRTVTDMQNKQECRMEPVTRTVTRFEFQFQSRFIPPRVDYLQTKKLKESAPVCYAVDEGAAAHGNRIEGRIYLPQRR
jgi:hypothetical protein